MPCISDGYLSPLKCEHFAKVKVAFFNDSAMKPKMSTFYTSQTQTRPVLNLNVLNQWVSKGLNKHDRFCYKLKVFPNTYPIFHLISQRQTCPYILRWDTRLTANDWKWIQWCTGAAYTSNYHRSNHNDFFHLRALTEDTKSYFYSEHFWRLNRYWCMLNSQM